MCYLQFLHGQLCAILFGTLHQDIQRIAVILPLGAQRLLPDGLLNAFLQGVTCTDTLQRNLKENLHHIYTPADFPCDWHNREI